MDLNDAVNEVLKYAPAFKEIRIIPMMLKENKHIVIADGKLIQGDYEPLQPKSEKYLNNKTIKPTKGF